MSNSLISFGRVILKSLDGRPQTWLAKETGIDKSTLNRIIKDEKIPDIEEAVMIASALRLDGWSFIDASMTGGDPKPLGKPLPEQQTNAKLLAAMNLMQAEIDELTAQLRALKSQVSPDKELSENRLRLLGEVIRMREVRVEVLLDNLLADENNLSSSTLKKS